MDIKLINFDNERLIFEIQKEYYNEKENTFINLDPVRVEMEHSLYTISKWESKYHKSFFSRKEKTRDEVIDYMYLMIQEPKELKMTIFLEFLSHEYVYSKITEYIEDSMTGTFFRNDNDSRNNNETVTTELLYFNMISCRIPLELEHWHINRLITLLKIFAVKNAPPKKRSQMSIMKEYDEINRQRRKTLNTKG